MTKHNCQTELDRAIKGNILLSPSHANDGDLWECACGKVWIHICDEAEGCYWVETEDHR